MNNKYSPRIYRLHVSLKEIRPTIWRRFKVKSDITLNRLDQVIQRVMGWTDYQRHKFRIGEYGYGPTDPDYDADAGGYTSITGVRLDDVVPLDASVFTYEHDCQDGWAHEGDKWEHELKLEAIVPLDPAESYPVCVAGERNCPPENCGGAGGYDDLLHTLKTHGHPQYRGSYWFESRFDPETFSTMAVNRKLKRFQNKPRAGAGR